MNIREIMNGGVGFEITTPAGRVFDLATFVIAANCFDVNQIENIEAISDKEISDMIFRAGSGGITLRLSLMYEAFKRSMPLSDREFDNLISTPLSKLPSGVHKNTAINVLKSVLAENYFEESGLRAEYFSDLQIKDQWFDLLLNSPFINISKRLLECIAVGNERRAEYILSNLENNLTKGDVMRISVNSHSSKTKFLCEQRIKEMITNSILKDSNIQVNDEKSRVRL